MQKEKYFYLINILHLCATCGRCQKGPEVCRSRQAHILCGVAEMTYISLGGDICRRGPSQANGINVPAEENEASKTEMTTKIVSGVVG